MTNAFPPLTPKSYPQTPTAPTAAPSGYVTPVTPPNAVGPPAGLTSTEISTRRGQFYELIIQQVVKALTGFIIPGSSATSQLAGFGANIPVIGPLVSAVTGLVGGVLNLDTLSNFFGNLGGFLPFNLNAGGSHGGGTFNPLEAGVNFISSILNLTTTLGGLLTGGLIPTLDGSKVGSGTVGEQFTGVGNLRDTVTSGLSGIPTTGATNNSLATLLGNIAHLLGSVFGTAATTQTTQAANTATQGSNSGVGGTVKVVTGIGNTTTGTGGAGNGPLP